MQRELATTVPLRSVKGYTRTAVPVCLHVKRGGSCYDAILPSDPVRSIVIDSAATSSVADFSNFADETRLSRPRFFDLLEHIEFGEAAHMPAWSLLEHCRIFATTGLRSLIMSIPSDARILRNVCSICELPAIAYVIAIAFPSLKVLHLILTYDEYTRSNQVVTPMDKTPSLDSLHVTLTCYDRCPDTRIIDWYCQLSTMINEDAEVVIDWRINESDPLSWVPDGVELEGAAFITAFRK